MLALANKVGIAGRFRGEDMKYLEKSLTAWYESASGRVLWIFNLGGEL